MKIPGLSFVICIHYYDDFKLDTVWFLPILRNIPHLEHAIEEH